MSRKNMTLQYSLKPLAIYSSHRIIHFKFETRFNLVSLKNRTTPKILPFLYLYKHIENKLVIIE